MARLTLLEIIEALQRRMGLIGAAAKDLGVTRQSLEQRIKRSPTLQQVCTDIRQSALDICEGVVMRHAVVDGDPGSAKWLLDRLGKERGYSRRTEVTGKDGAPIDLNQAIEDLNDDQALLLRRLIDAGKTGQPEP